MAGLICVNPCGAASQAAAGSQPAMLEGGLKRPPGAVGMLVRRDLGLAERLLADHIETSKKNAIELFFRDDEKGESAVLPVNPQPA